MFNGFEKYNKVLSLNERNLKYIRSFNPPYARKFADDKLLTKEMLAANNIESPTLVGKISNIKQLEKFNFSKLQGSVVVKPKHGFGGEGIIVFFSKDKNGDWVKADKTRYTERDLRNHIRGILEGNYSLKNQPDVAFFEERVLLHPDFKPYSYRGMPDIRIIVFNKVPVMAMLRLPTHNTDGKANLHAGGIGVGIDIERGITTYAIQHDKPVELHPDTGNLLRGFQIPYWNKILDIAVKTQVYSGLGFLGVDIVVDRIKGPLVLELNARPGLALQIANNDGLRGRLERVAGLKINSVERGIKVGKNLFGGEVDEEIEEVSGKKLVGYVEQAKLYGINGEAITVKVKNDSGALWSSIDEELAGRLGFNDVIEEFDEFERTHHFSNLKDGQKVKYLAQRHFEDHSLIANVVLIKQAAGLDLRPVIKIDFEMSGIKFNTPFTITRRKDLVYDALVGRRTLKEYLLDPSTIYLG